MSHSLRMLDSAILCECFLAKMLMISSKASSIEYCVCIKANPLSLSWPIVDCR